MNKAELAALIAERLGESKKKGEDFVAAFEDIVTETLVQGGDVTIAGFGNFSSKVRAGRMGVNPQNPTERIQIPPVTVPKFKAGKALKDALKANDKKKDEPELPPSTPEPMM
jgi:DNA-binding protein HU-beta